MTLAPSAVVIGLTGPFGSGCTTAAEILKSRLRYYEFRISDIVRERWNRENPGVKPSRGDLQRLGNQIRKDAADPGALAWLAVQELEALKTEEIEWLVLDGIRNVGEIESLKERFGRRFYLLALECGMSDRLDRLVEVYGTEREGRERFRADNERDRDQEDPIGQQVELCVDAADVVIINDNRTTLHEFKGKLTQYVRLVTGERPRYARPAEILMNLAYSAAHGSKCLKRQVGAVVVLAPPLEPGEVVGQGYNENPSSTRPCVEEPKYGASAETNTPGRCYRDIVRFDSFMDLADQGAKCPNCGDTIKEPTRQEPRWLCVSCEVNLEDYFWPERAMWWCTAVHAEVAAILVAGLRARGATLYTTTFPCFQCAEKIVQAGIKSVVFTEPYPDIRAAGRLQIAGVKTTRFEGVRSGRFHEIFSRARPYVSRQRTAMSQKKQTGSTNGS